MRSCLHVVLLALFLPATAQDVPPALETYKGRRIARTMHYAGAPWLIRESREREEECTTLLRVLDLQPGQAVCDLGCGNGFYTLPMAEAVGAEGRVFAVDIQEQMLEFLADRAEAAGLSGRIEPVLGTLIDPKLPPDALDLVLLVDVYHELSHPVHVLAAIRRSLGPHGCMVLVEFREEDPEVPIKPLHKMSKRQILREIPPNGFRVAGQYDGLPWQHVMFFERAPEGPLADRARAALVAAVSSERAATPATNDLKRRAFMLTGDDRLYHEKMSLTGAPRGSRPAPADPPDDDAVRAAIESLTDLAIADRAEFERSAVVLCDYLERAPPSGPADADEP